MGPAGRVAPGWGVAVAVACVSFAAPLFVLADAHPVTASFWRLLLAVVLLAPFTRGAWQAWARYTIRQWLGVAGVGCALGAHFALWVWSLHHTSVAAATTLVTLQAVFVALGGHFVLADRLGPRAWAGVGLAVAGAVVIAAGDHADAGGRALRGDALALAAGAMSALYFLAGRRLRRSRGLVEYVAPVYLAAALGLAAVSPLVDAQLLDVGGPAWTYFVLLAAVPMLGGHTMANWAIRYLPAHVVATWILLEPLGAALLAWPILGQVPSWWVAAGGAVAIAGAALTVQGQVVADEPPG